MIDLLTRFALVGAAVLFAMWLALTGGRWLARQLAAMRPYLAAFVIFTFVAMNYAQKPGGTNSVGQVEGGTNELMRTTEIAETAGAGTENGWGRIVDRFPQPPIRVAEGASVPSVVEMFLLESVATNDSYSFSMPSNGTRYVNWWLRGAYEDVFRLNLGEMRFPCGTNLCDSLWVYTWGMAGIRLGDASNRLVAAGVPMSAVPGLSQFWSADVDNGAKLLTWENFFLNRDTNTPVSAQLELMPSGDFVARSNLVETVYRRVNPDDWDDDGIPNEYDLDPLSYDGDNFGPHQQLPNGADTNHYYWIDVVVSQANARVTFEGDGYSHLSDPVFIARAGETNRVVLLLGKSYVIRCNMPIQVIDREDDEIDVSVGGGNISVVWPVYVSFVPLMRGGCATTATVMPQRANGGSFSWPDNFCCYSFAAGAVPIFDCDGTCGCGGCSTGDISYEIGGHELTFGGINCGCHHEGEPTPEGGGGEGESEPSGPAVSVLFSKNAIIFEESYVNMPGVLMPRRSSDSELTCEVYGGTNGGHYAFALYDGGRLVRKSGSYIPRSGMVEAGETFRIKIKYEALAASFGVGDIRAEAVFTENDTGRELTSEAVLTAVKAEVVAVHPAPANKSPRRHVYGPQELAKILTTPDIVSISCSAGCVTNVQGDRAVMMPPNGCTFNVTATHLAATYDIPITIVAPTHHVATNCVAVGTNDWPSAHSNSVPQPGDLWVAMSVDLKLMPDYVSFENVYLQEGYCEATNIHGFFLQTTILPHGTGAGAWREVDVGEGNFVGDDFASAVFSSHPDATTQGGYAYQIPVRWYVKSGGMPVAYNPMGNVPMVFTLSPNGDFSVSKFGCTAVRDITGHTTTTGP